MKKDKLTIILTTFLILYFILITQNLPVGTAEDEGSHSMDSFFYYILFRDLILNHNILFDLENYVYKFYAHYPALYIIEYPPLFGILSSFLFFIMGIDLFFVRLVSIIFSILSLICLYYLGSELYNKKVAFFSVFILSFAPYFFIYSRLAMLEIPLMFFILSSILFFYRAVEKKQKKYFYYLGFVLGVGFLLKYTIIFMIISFVLYLIYKKGGKSKLKILITSFIIFTLVCLPYIIILLFFRGLEAAIIYPFRVFIKPISFKYIYYYFSALFWNMCPLVFLIPIFYLFKRRGMREDAFLFFIILTYFITLTIMPIKHTKYIMPLIPLFSLLFIHSLIKDKRIFLVIFSIVFIYQLTLCLLPHHLIIQNENTLKTDTTGTSDYINKNIVMNGNIFLMPNFDNAIWIFNFARINDFQNYVFRWRDCIFDNMTTREFENYITKNNMFYIVVGNRNDTASFELRNWTKNNFIEVERDNNLIVYQNPEKKYKTLEIVCQYNCRLETNFCFNTSS